LSIFRDSKGLKRIKKRDVSLFEKTSLSVLATGENLNQIVEFLEGLKNIK